MTQGGLIVAVIDALDSAGVTYLLAGSLAANVYSVPRSTKDADFVVEMNSEVLSKVQALLDPLFDLDPQQHLETTTWTRRYIFKARQMPFEVEFFLKSTDPHHLEQWQRRKKVRIEFLDRTTWLPTPEDIIIQKLRWGRSKDLADVAGVITVRKGGLDWSYIHRWCDVHSSRKKLDEILKTIPQDLLE
jgi:hypothetical protein